MTQTWELPNGTWTQDESGYWETPETTKPTGALLTLAVTIAGAIWFMIWSKHTGTNTGKTGSQLPSCISYYAAHHFIQPPNFGDVCY